MADTRLQQLAKTDRNPIEETEYKRLLGQASLPYFQGGNESNTAQFNAFAFQNKAGGTGTGSSSFDPIAQAQKILEFQKQANQPVVQSLQGQVDPLKQRYADLLKSIKGEQQVAEQRQTLATSNELGRRGILTGSGYGQQELANALTPIGAQYGGLYANAGLAENQDLMNLANKIASLQAGNPESAFSGALNVGQMQQQAQQASAQLALQQLAQQQESEYRQQALSSEDAYRQAQIGAMNRTQEQNPFVTLGEGQTLFNLLQGRPIYTAPKTFKSGGGGGNYDPLGLF